MARITKRQKDNFIKAEKEKQKLLRKLSTPIMYRLGITNSIAVNTILDAEDSLEGLYEEGSDTAKVLEYARHMSELNELYVRKSYDGDDNKYSFYFDTCNHAYGEVEEHVENMKNTLVKYLNGVGTSNPEMKANITIAWLAIKIASVVYKSLRRKIMATKKVDIERNFCIMDYTPLFDRWEVIIKTHGQIEENESSIDIFCVEGFRDAYREFERVVTDPYFVDTELRWAAAMNKNSMPEIYDSILKSVQEENERDQSASK